MKIFKDKRTYEEKDMIRFNDLLDNLAVTYVARDQVRQELIEN